MTTSAKDEAYLASLCRRAEELGARRAAPISAGDVVIDDRALLKCQVPLCPHYGRDLMCPPNVMPVAQFREVVGRYSRAIVVNVAAAAPGGAVGGKPDGDAAEDPAWTGYLGSLREARNRLCDVIGGLEAACIGDGHYCAAGFAGGSCTLCEEYVGVASGLPCLYSFRARPAMEAMGIDVMVTAGRAASISHLGRKPAGAGSGCCSSSRSDAAAPSSKVRR